MSAVAAGVYIVLAFLFGLWLGLSIGDGPRFA